LRLQLSTSGHQEQLERKLNERLKECGWQDAIVAKCIELVEEKGVDNVTEDELVAAVTPQARATVPDNLKAELLGEIRAFIASIKK
jgi:enhancer of yellow 2 transcription factor